MRRKTALLTAVIILIAVAVICSGSVLAKYVRSTGEKEISLDLAAKYKLRLNSNGEGSFIVPEEPGIWQSIGSDYAEKNVEVGESFGELPYASPSAIGSIADGWVDDFGNLCDVTLPVSEAKDLTLYPNWRPIEYNVLYHYNRTADSEFVEDDIVLPDGYRRELYLECDGNQYIKTGICVDNANCYEISAKYLAMDTNGKSVWGNQSGNRSFNLYLSGGYMYFYSGSNVASTSTCRKVVSVGTVYELTASIDCPNHMINAVVNGETLPAYKYAGTSSEDEIYLMDNAGQNGQKFKGRIYCFEMKENGVPIRCFVPCTRTADDVAGMYDTVHGDFYENSGSGKFAAPVSVDEVKKSGKIKYGEVYTLESGVFTRENYDFLCWNTERAGLGTEYSDAQQVVNLTASDGDMIHLYAMWQYNGSSVLPPEYEALPYIHTDGNQYIDTGISITDKDVLKINADFVVGTSENKSLWGNQPSDTARSFGLFMYSKVMCFFAGSTTARNSICKTDVCEDSRYEVSAEIDASLKKISAVVNHTTLPDYTYTGNVSTGNIHLFNNAGQTQYFIGDLYYFEMEKNGEPVRRFAPCVRTGDGAVGLYDVIGSRFYPSEGSGDFMAP